MKTHKLQAKVRNAFTLSAITLTAIIIIALGFWSLQSYNLEDSITALEQDEAFIDFFMEDFITTAMDEDGKPGYTIKATRLEHLNNSDYSSLKNPVINLLRQKNNWTITANNGAISDDQKLITLYENVVLNQPGATEPIEIKTSQLKIDTRKKIASTEEDVIINQQNFSLTATGMIIDHAAGQFELLSNIDSDYEQDD